MTEKKQKIIFWLWGGAYMGKEKNLFCLGFGQFLQMRWGLQLSVKAALSFDSYILSHKGTSLFEKE